MPYCNRSASRCHHEGNAADGAHQAWVAARLIFRGLEIGVAASPRLTRRYMLMIYDFKTSVTIATVSDYAEHQNPVDSSM